MRYYSASRDRTDHREVDPYRLWYTDGSLYLIGYCHRRKEIRMFAVERILSLTLTDRPWQLPLGFDIETYVQDALVVMRGKPTDVTLSFDKVTTAWAKDRVWHPSQRITLDQNGRMTMTLRVADTRELEGWILHFGSGVRVLHPESLRERIKDEARKIFSQA
jgi:predicted DNA-binding transcriptional regulator YafY